MKKIFFGLNLLALFILTTPALAALQNPAPGLFAPSLGDNTIPGIIEAIVKLLLTFVGILAILFIVIGGFQYITSAGNEERAAAGKKTLTNAIIGLVIVLLSYVIVVVIINTVKPS